MTKSASTVENQRLLVVSNGHGEDDIACKIVAAMEKISPVTKNIEAWPMVGDGKAYNRIGVPTIGPKNTLPSAGFATLDWRLMTTDLQNGWIGTHWKQLQFARTLGDRYDAMIGVGDVIPLAVSWFGGIPMFFVGCAKSAYYERGDGYSLLEKRLMRRCCSAIFPRDELTSTRLEKSGVANEFLGNPMMDGLELEIGSDLICSGEISIALLPGSRQDSVDNLLLLMAAASKISNRHEQSGQLRFTVAAHHMLPLGELRRGLAADATEWQEVSEDAPDAIADNSLRFVHRSGSQVLVAKNRFSEFLHAASIVIGMAGTANEQAVGLGKPLVAVPSTGVQGGNYVRMKMKFFGDSAVMSENDPEIIAKVTLSLLRDDAACHRMALAGRERMGPPGASKAIADRIQDILNSQRIGSR